MNYYNPYYYEMPNAFSTQEKSGIFSRLFKGNVNFNSIINNTGKVLQIANQAIPLVKQVTPVIRNAKTMFRVLNEFKKNDQSINNQRIKSNRENDNTIYDNNYSFNSPTFFQ